MKEDITTNTTKWSFFDRAKVWLEKILPSFLNPWIKQLFRPTVQSILLITGLLFASRFFGFIRQILIYQKMDPIASDLLLSAVKIPETIATFLIMGTIVSSVLPVASRIESATQSLEHLSKYLNLILFTLLSIILALISVLFVFTPQVLELVTSQEILDSYRENGIFEDYVWVTRILLSGPLLFTVQAVLGVFLTMKKRFLVYGSASVIYNLGAVLALAVSNYNDYFLVAWGMTIGAATASLVYWITALKIGLRGKYLVFPNKIIESFKIHQKDFWQTWRLFLPRIFLINGAVFANLIIIFIAQDNGQITALDIALSIQAVFLVLIGAIGAVFFPDLARLLNESKENSRPFWRKLFSYTQKTGFITFVGAVITFFAIPVVMWLFELFGRGQGNADYIVYLARIATIGLVFQAVNEILIKYFFVRERVWQPVLISVFGTIMQIVITFILLGFSLDAGAITSFALVANNLGIMLVSFWLIFGDYREDLGRTKKVQS